MATRMPAEDVNKLRYEILRMCDDANGKNASEIIADESISDLTSKYARVTIMNMVQALTKTELLIDNGVSRGKLYFTSLEGRYAAQRFKLELKSKK